MRRTAIRADSLVHGTPMPLSASLRLRRPDPDAGSRRIVCARTRTRVLLLLVHRRIVDIDDTEARRSRIGGLLHNFDLHSSLLLSSAGDTMRSEEHTSE